MKLISVLFVALILISVARGDDSPAMKRRKMLSEKRNAQLKAASDASKNPGQDQQKKQKKQGK